MSHNVEGIHIRPDKSVETITLKDYQDYSRAVDGYIEAVRLVTPTEPRYEATMYVNEEFLLGQFGPKDFNSIATDLAGFCGRPDLLMQGILGPVVVVGSVDNAGYDKNIPEPFVRLINIIREEAAAGTTPLNEANPEPTEPAEEQ